jgi:hypothetical protein
VSLSIVRCALRRLEASVAVFHRDLDLTRTAPCVRIFGSVVWYPVFLRHEIPQHLAHQVGGYGVFLLDLLQHG